MSEADEEYLWIPTITQQKIVSLLPIIPSLLSFIGSSLIIYHVIHDRRKTPYRRLLLAMSSFDILSTIGSVSQPFLMPSNVINSYVWSFGNETSCNVIAAILQTAIAAHLYNSCLSFYFVLTIRFGMREQTFAKRIEKVMHFVVITFSLGTAVLGWVTGMYYPSHIGPGCWVSHPPEGDICANDSCGAEKIAWIFAGFPTVLCTFSIAINNLLLYCHVRSTVLRGQAKAVEMEKKLANYRRNQSAEQQEEGKVEEDTIQKSSSISLSGRLSGRWSGRLSGRWSSGSSSLRTDKPSSVLRSSDKQWKRVKEVGTQSFLYVASYFFCFIWTTSKGVLDGQGFDNLEGSGSIFFPLVILQSIFHPIQGFFSCVIFFRPKYLQARSKYGRETRLWCMKRAVFAEKIRPTCPPSRPLTARQLGKADQRINYAGELEGVLPTPPGSAASHIESIAEALANESDDDSVEVQSKIPDGSSFFCIQSMAESGEERNQESVQVQSNHEGQRGQEKHVSKIDDEEQLEA